MSNRLAKESSPYLRQHGENPVDWYPWCEEAFQRAKQNTRIPTVIECIINRECNVLPIVPPGNSLGDMILQEGER